MAGFQDESSGRKVLAEAPAKLSAGDFYETYHGHTVNHLETLHASLCAAGVLQFIYFAGDSSLDNKHWFFNGSRPKKDQLLPSSEFVADATNGYEYVLQPPYMVKDVCYWLNQACEERRLWAHADAPAENAPPRIAAINTAVEESCLSQREVEGLLPQDNFIRSHISENDILVVDVGGNDVALRPTIGVIVNIAMLLYLTPTPIIRASMAPGLVYFVHMFRVRLRRYIEQLVEVRKPKKVVVCMLYFLDEQSGGSWADTVLGKLGYDSNPEKLQVVMRKVYSWGVSQLTIPGVEVVPLPLYEVLDGKDTTDYVQRVEPSVTGGRKMAEAIADKIFE